MDEDNPKCSFCDKRRDQVEVLIAVSGSVAICAECVDLCKRDHRGRAGQAIYSAVGRGSGEPQVRHSAGRHDHQLRRSVCAAGQPASPQVSRCIGLSGSDLESRR
jgi:hypothetical protein